MTVEETFNFSDFSDFCSGRVLILTFVERFKAPVSLVFDNYDILAEFVKRFNIKQYSVMMSSIVTDLTIEEDNEEDKED